LIDRHLYSLNQANMDSFRRGDCEKLTYYFLDKIEVIFIFSIVKMRMHLQLAQSIRRRNEFNAKNTKREIVQDKS
jgi:hypothetical protein